MGTEIKSAKLFISGKVLRGDDGYKTFSVRIKEETVDKLDKIAADSNRSRNKIINILLEYVIDNCELL